MTTATPGPPAGWYPDPSATPQAPVQRYWDGGRWTEHAAPGPLPTWNGKEATTPDGVPLATWGRRLGAYVIDWVALAVLGTVAGFPFLRVLAPRYLDQLSQTTEPSSTGPRPFAVFDFYRDNLGPVLGYAAVTVAVLVLYNVLLLRFRGGTLGKLALGLRVRLREPVDDATGRRDGLAWRVVLRRVGTQHWPALVAWIPFLGLVGLWSWVDGLWPLWDARRQALHDKAAGTCVVDRRAARD